MTIVPDLPRPIRLAGAVLLASSLALFGCSDSSGTDVGGPPAEMVVLDGDDQEGIVGEELPEPLVVKVTDQRGRAVRGQLVNWRVTQGGGSVFAGSAITDSKGEARERWTLGTVAGAAQQVEARAVDNQSGAALVFATFAATAKAGAATALTAVTTGALAGTAGQPLSTQIVVRVADQYGNAVSGASVTWEAAGGGSAAPATSTTDAAGEARTTWTLGAAAGTQQLTARSGTLTPVTFAATARAGGPARLEIVSGNEHDGTVGEPLGEGLVVRAVDALGNNVPNVPITWSVRTGGGTVSPAAATTNDAGVAQTVWTLGTTAGTQTAAASAPGVQDALFTARALVAAPSTIAIVSGDAQEAVVGQQLSQPLVVRVTDRYGNPTPDVAVSWAVSAGGGSVAAVDAETDDDGRASARWTVGSVGDGNRVTATAAPGVAATFRATGLLGGAGRLESAGLTFESSPPGTGAGAVFSRYTARVRLLSANGEGISDAQVTWTATGGGSATPASSRTDASGYATTSWQLGTMVGENTLTARALDVEPVTFRITTTGGPVCSAYIRYEDGTTSATAPVGGRTSKALYAYSFDQFGNPAGGYSPSPFAYPSNLGYSLAGSFSTDASGRSGPVYVDVSTTPSTQEFLYQGFLCQGTTPGLLTPRLQTYSFSASAVPVP